MSGLLKLWHFVNSSGSWRSTKTMYQVRRDHTRDGVTTKPILRGKQCRVEYGEISNISDTKFQNLNDFRLVLQLSLCNLLKPDVKSRMKMQLDRRCSNYIWVINNFITYKGPGLYWRFDGISMAGARSLFACCQIRKSVCCACAGNAFPASDFKGTR